MSDDANRPSYPGDDQPKSPYGGDGSTGGPTPPTPPTWSGGSENFQPPFDAPSAIAWGWRKFVAEIGSWILVALIFLGLIVALIVAGMVLSIGDALVDPDATGQASYGTSVSLFIVSAIFSLGLWILSATIFRGALDVTEGRAFNIGSAFSRINLPNVIVLGIISAVVSNIGSLVPGPSSAVLSLLGLVFAFFTYFAMLFLVDRDQTAIQAIGSSFSLISGNLGSCLLLAILNILVIAAGLLVCGIGIFVAYPIVTLASTYAYRRLQDQPVVE